MLFKIAANRIQAKVKNALGLSKTPLEATSANIRKILADKGLKEPYDRDDCDAIADEIISKIRKRETAIIIQDEENLDSTPTVNLGEQDMDNIVDDSVKNSNSNDIPAVDVESNQSAIAVTEEQRQMVAFKAQSMGIQLAESQVSEIASQIDSRNSNFIETIKQIEQALLDYVDYNSLAESTVVNRMFEKVNNRIVQNSNSINQQLSSGLESIGESLRQNQASQATATQNILARLRIPSN